MIDARRRAGFLLYAAVQFVALTTLAMALYAGGTWLDPAAGGYHFFHNFLSDLGATRGFSGRSNLVAAPLFSIALGTLGIALVWFAAAWRQYAFARGRARAAGYASHACGVASGLAFTGVALVPIDRAVFAHNALVVAAFAFLLGYSVALTILMARNGIRAARLAVHGVYVVLVLAYVAIVLVGPRFGTPDGFRVQVTAQKVIAYASMLHVGFLTYVVRRAAPAPAPAPAPPAAAPS